MTRADRTPRQRLDAEERRKAILDAGRGLFAGSSFSEVSTQRVAAAAGASQALVFHYFGSKAGLYTAVVEDAVEHLQAALRSADRALPAGAPTRDRVRAALLVYLDEVARYPRAWAPHRGAEEPAAATAVRLRARADQVAGLRGWLRLDAAAWPRHEYALWGFFGFVDSACLAWVDAGCPEADRHPLVEAALGALEGALGDWGG
nr:TetR/AcrR family transcriptional regulator [Propionibacterium sp.]